MTDDDFNSLYWAAESYRSSRQYVRAADPVAVPVTHAKMRGIADEARQRLLAEVMRIAMSLTIDDLPADLPIAYIFGHPQPVADPWPCNAGRPADLPPG